VAQARAVLVPLRVNAECTQGHGEAPAPEERAGNECDRDGDGKLFHALYLGAGSASSDLRLYS
jgi:hypothetical protein